MKIESRQAESSILEVQFAQEHAFAVEVMPCLAEPEAILPLPLPNTSTPVAAVFVGTTRDGTDFLERTTP